MHPRRSLGTRLGTLPACASQSAPKGTRLALRVNLLVESARLRVVALGFAFGFGSDPGERQPADAPRGVPAARVSAARAWRRPPPSPPPPPSRARPSRRSSPRAAHAEEPPPLSPPHRRRHWWSIAAVIPAASASSRRRRRRFEPRRAGCDPARVRAAREGRGPSRCAPCFEVAASVSSRSPAADTSPSCSRKASRALTSSSAPRRVAVIMARRARTPRGTAAASTLVSFHALGALFDALTTRRLARAWRRALARERDARGIRGRVTTT